MTYQIEVCVENIESCAVAEAAGASRIELCGALAVGGITPSIGFMELARFATQLPIYAMIRPRSGDFYFSSQEIAMMLREIEAAKQAKLDGIVIGSLDKAGKVDRGQLNELISAAGSLGVTFHRAIDLCTAPEQGIEEIIAAGCERILTSGQAATAVEGIDTIIQWQKLFGDHIKIMAGAGINECNASKIIARANIQEIHLSAKTSRQPNHRVALGSTSKGAKDSIQTPITSPEILAQVVRIIDDAEVLK